jgi:Putative oxidoreductase C terminal domain
LWNFETPAGGGDTHLAVFRGSKSRIEVRQGKEQKYRPELYVVPNSAGEKDSLLAALRKKVESLVQTYPGIDVSDLGKEIQITIPDKYRVGHEAHFAQVTNRFLEYLKNPKSLPAWEKPNMIAKYYVTTKGLELSRQGTTASK